LEAFLTNQVARICQAVSIEMHFQLQLRHGQRQTWFWTDVQELSHALNSFNAKRQMVELL
jgi:hypothetical protein